MKVLYDHQIFELQKYGGISRYFLELISADNSYNKEISIKYSINDLLIDSHIIPSLKKKMIFEDFLPRVRSKYKKKIWKYYNKVANYRQNTLSNTRNSILKIQESNFDVFHPTYFDPYFLPFLSKKPFVLTIYDMIYEKFPEFTSPNIDIVRNKKLLAEKATKIIAISNRTKNDIINCYDIDESKIVVIYLGSNLSQNITSSNQLINNYGRYFLFTGSRGAYKNFYFMLYVLAPILKDDQDVSLICTGSTFSAKELDLFANLGIEKQIKHIFASDSELFGLYHNAIAFIFPSYYEGFGIPILEAFEAECPVLLANASCFPEIAQDAALYFDPKSNIEIRNACELVMKDSKVRADLIQKGKDRLSFFSWQKCAKETEDLYKTIV